jgi:hypothetical protein
MPSSVRIGETEYTVSPARSEPGMVALFVLAKYAKPLMPIIVQAGKTDATQLALDTLTALADFGEGTVGDLFRIVSLLSGIDADVLKGAEFKELGAVLSAVARENDLVKFFSMAVQVGG